MAELIIIHNIQSSLLQLSNMVDFWTSVVDCQNVDRTEEREDSEGVHRPVLLQGRCQTDPYREYTWSSGGWLQTD